VSDIMLGWTHMPDTDTGTVRDYYVRQLWDGKGAFDLEQVDAISLRLIAEVCGNTLAHAHARTGDRITIAAYLGKGDDFDRGMRTFARTYADLAERDHAAFVAALDGEEPQTS
jgi:predicted alpha/beta hydrolase